jgi:hypothetical protein
VVRNYADWQNVFSLTKERSPNRSSISAAGKST